MPNGITRAGILLAALLPRIVWGDVIVEVGPEAGIKHPQEALETLRVLRSFGSLPKSETVRVQIADGVYPLVSPMVFGPQDGGFEGGKVIYEAARGASPTLSGGRRIVGWDEGSDGIWRVAVPNEPNGTPWRFQSLWVNGARAVRAREPDAFFHYLEGVTEELLPEGGGSEARQTLSMRAEDLSVLQGADAAALEIAEILLFHKWDNTRRWIESVDIDAGRLTIQGTAMKSWNPLARDSGFVLENLPGALDRPGEWYLDTEGVLGYIPRPGERIEDVEAIAPALDGLLLIQGEAGPMGKVSHLEFRGLRFMHAGWSTPKEGFGPAQAAAPIEAAVQLDGVRDVAFIDCEIGHVDGYGLWFRKGCEDSRVFRSWIHDLGAGGVRVGEASIRQEASQRTKRIEIDNNIIVAGGRVFPCAVGVWIGHSPENRVTRNEIADFFYTGVSVGWRWGYGESLAKNNTIAFNHIHHIGQGWLSDMGGIYTLGPSQGTEIRHNVIHDIHSWGYGGWGLYNDEGSAGILLENNLVYRTKSGGYHQHYGRDNVIRNNIFAFASEWQLQRTRVEDHRSFTFAQNIVLWDRGDLFRGNWDDQVDLSQNLYWAQEAQTRQRLASHMEDRRKNGADLGSVVVDPRFVDPKNGDFRFVDESAARAIDFEPFNPHAAGVYGPKEWIEKARRQPMPEVAEAPEPANRP